MTQEEMNNIFDFLEKEMNSLNLYDLKTNEFGNIVAYFKGTDEKFCRFYSDEILNYLKKLKESDK